MNMVCNKYSTKIVVIIIIIHNITILIPIIIPIIIIIIRIFTNSIIPYQYSISMVLVEVEMILLIDIIGDNSIIDAIKYYYY